MDGNPLEASVTRLLHIQIENCSTIYTKINVKTYKVSIKSLRCISLLLKGSRNIKFFVNVGADYEELSSTTSYVLFKCLF